MPDDKNRKKPGKSGAAKPPVIDVQARKVGEVGKDRKPASSGDSGSKDGGSGKTASQEAAGCKASAADSGKPKQTGKAGKTTKPAAEPAAGKKSGSGKEPGKEEASAKPAEAGGSPGQETKRKKSRTGLKLLLGLLALGGAAGGGAWLYQQYGPEKTIQSLQQQLAAMEQKLAASERASALAGEVAALKNRLQQVQEEQAALSATVREMSKSDGGELPLRVKALEEKLAALEKLPGQVEELGQRAQTLDKSVAALGEQMKTLKQALAEMASDAPAAADSGMAGTGAAAGAGAGAGAGMAASIATLKLSGKQLEQKIAHLAEQIDEIRKGADPARFKALEARIAKQEEALIRAQEELRALAQRAEAAAEQAAQQAKAALTTAQELKANPPVPKFTPPPEGVAYATLREKANAGESYKAELGRLAALMPDAPGLDALSRYSEQGVPTTAALARQLADLRKRLSEAAKPARKPAAEDPIGALKDKLMQVVKVRRADEVDWPAVLAAAEQAMRSGGLAAALAELMPHKDKMPKDVAQWAAQARARLAVDKALNELAEAVLRRSTRGGGE